VVAAGLSTTADDFRNDQTWPSDDVCRATALTSLADLAGPGRNAPQQRAPLFDHLVGERERHLAKAERSCGLGVSPTRIVDWVTGKFPAIHVGDVLL
jgi:hypothetical protein